MSQELSRDQLHEIIETHVAQLMEHFDSVTILTTFYNGATEDTDSYEGAGGNLYARIGRAKEWVLEQDQHVKIGMSKKFGKSK